MSLKAEAIPEVPVDTERIAHAALPPDNLCLAIRDRIGMIYRDNQFQPLFATRGQPAECPWRLALVCILQFAENLSDRQAANAVRTRIDWKYLLSLSLEDTGFHYSVLSEFRSRLVNGEGEHFLFEALLNHLKASGLLKARGQQRTDSTHVLAAIRALNRLECVGETLRHTLNSLADVAPDWLLAHSSVDWVERYGHRVEDYRLPAGEQKRVAYAEVIGADGLLLLEAIDGTDTPTWLQTLPAVDLLRQVWQQNYRVEAGRAYWRSAEQLPASREFIGSPYDPEARYTKKRSTSWVGYKVHFTETCATDLPHLITQVDTTPATTTDDAVVSAVHQQLDARQLLPETHLVDGGYSTAAQVLASQHVYGIDLFGPARANYHWQARAGNGFAVQDFAIDWEQQQAVCPVGKTSISWTPAFDNRGRAVIKVKFSLKDCRKCRCHAQCTRAPRRGLSIRPEPEYRTLQATRDRQKTEAFATRYAQRAGIEGTISQAVRAFDLRRSRYLGQAKTHLQHVLTALAINLVRVVDWLCGYPIATTRQSRFVTLIRTASS